MSTAIAVTSTDLVLPLLDQHTPTAAVLRAPEAQSLEAALLDMRVTLDQHGYVVVLYPATLSRAFERRLHAVRALLESDRVAFLRSDLPPLGLAVLVRQLRQLSVCDFSAGVLASAARLLSYYIHCGALLGSVAKLDRVPVSLTSHARSWIPGSQFGVVAGPEPQLVKVGGGTLAGPEYDTRLLVARGQLQSDWVTGTLAPDWKVQGVEETDLPADSPRWWGTGKLIEFAAHIPDLSVLYQLVASVRREWCHWCGMELIGDRCGFCAAPLSTGESRALPPGVTTEG